jgi:membrane protease YdiL (CAAX protease family)
MNQGMRPRRASLTVAYANLVLLVSIIAVLAGSFVTAGWPTYRVLSIREVLFILLPACLVVLARRLPARDTLRLRWPGGRIVAASALIGAGGWLIDSWLGVVSTGLLGYTTPLPPDFFPTTPRQALVLALALAILAPICEEMLFRGVILRGYEELGPRAAILASGALFVLFHQSLPQGLALLPLAFLLGYMVWRSDSLLSGIVAHAANNALAACLIVLATADPEIAPFVGTLPAALAGVALVMVGLWGFRRWATRPKAVPAVPSDRPNRDVGFWLRRVWPLFVIVPIVTVTVGLEAILGWFPEALALGQQVRWSSPPWDGPHAWTYEVRDALAAAEEPLGQVRCALSVESTAYVLACSRQSAYEADAGREMDSGGEVDEQWTARWQRSGLRLSSAERRTQWTAVDGGSGSRESSVVPGADTVEVTIRRDGGAPERPSFPLEPSSSPLRPGRAFEPTVLEGGEWPWRFSALPFSGFYSAGATMIDPEDWREGAGDAVRPTHVVVYGAEPIKTPAGTYIAWHVRVGDDLVAWYDVEHPHTLIALDNGRETWGLTSIE